MSRFSLGRYTEAQGAVLPLVPYLDSLRWLFIALALAGIGVAVWARVDDWQQIDLSDYPNVLRWYRSLAARDAVQRGYQVPRDVGPIPMPSGD